MFWRRRWQWITVSVWAACRFTKYNTGQLWNGFGIVSGVQSARAQPILQICTKTDWRSCRCLMPSPCFEPLKYKLNSKNDPLRQSSFEIKGKLIKCHRSKLVLTQSNFLSNYENASRWGGTYRGSSVVDARARARTLSHMTHLVQTKALCQRRPFTLHPRKNAQAQARLDAPHLCAADYISPFSIFPLSN